LLCLAFLVVSGICLVSGLWVWHMLSRLVRGVPSMRLPVVLLARVTTVLAVCASSPTVDVAWSCCM